MKGFWLLPFEKMPGWLRWMLWPDDFVSQIIAIRYLCFPQPRGVRLGVGYLVFFVCSFFRMIGIFLRMGSTLLSFLDLYPFHKILHK